MTGRMRSLATAIGLSALLAALLALVAFSDPAPAAAQGQPAPRPITLDEALALAQKNAPAMIQAEGQRRVAKAAVRSSVGAFIPTLSVSAGLSRQYPSRAGSRIENGQVIQLAPEPWSFSSSFGSNVTLFDAGQRFFDLKQARARASAAEVDLVAQRFSTALAVKQEYFNVLAARESRAVSVAQVEQAAQQLRVASLRLKAGAVTTSDSLRADIQLRSARLALVDAEHAIVNADASLTRAVGSTELVTAVEIEPAPPAPLALDEAALRSLAENGPLVEEAQKSLEAARAALRSTWTTYLPTVNLGYSRSMSGTRDDFGVWADDPSYSGSLRFSLSLPIFNQFNREQQVTSSQVAVQNAEASLRDARLAAAESFASAYGTVSSADERVASQIASVGAAEEDLRVQQRRYELGSSTVLDVLTSQAQLDAARRDLIRARYDQRIARAQLEALVGRTLEGGTQ
jgi:outer membrane protein